MTKPFVSTVIALGLARPPKFQGKRIPVLWGQVRGFYKPNGGLLKGSPGERSIFGEHRKEGETSRACALRCATQEFLLDPQSWQAPITEDDFTLLAEGVETEKTINDVYLFNSVLTPESIDIGEGDALLRIPLKQVPWYVRDGHLTQASITCLKAVPPLEELWEMLE